ncbi:unnamed protein product [Brachionus calyciflorus]|uniref:Peptidase S1 domain-containing protein n=1 Tax=Brachionus calyciflorus TaxID=104777 RepID=A0A814ICE1_9BILA|nr:unnamed protein product [Brachionus calyciflorus]
MEIFLKFLLVSLANFLVVSSQVVKNCKSGNIRYNCEECGMIRKKTARIIGGKQAFDSEWPSIAYVTLRYNFDLEINGQKNLFLYNRTCAATLINKRTLITGASCYEKQITFTYNSQVYTVNVKPNNYHPTIESIFNVYLGVTNIGSIRNGKKNAGLGVKVNIEKFIMHPDYSEENRLNDIAILRLKSNVEYSNRIQPACLPNSQIKNYPTKTNIPVWAGGWGVINSRGTYPDTLYVVQMSLLPSARCSLVLPSMLKNWNTQICAGVMAGGKDTCKGDNGAPLFIKDKINNVEKYVFVGITSYGESCAKKNRPGIYTKVSSFLNWINENSAFVNDNQSTVKTTKQPAIISSTFSSTTSSFLKNMCFDGFDDGFCDECGKTFKQPNVKIVGGIQAVPNSWPSMVFIKVFTVFNTQFYCGATLINRDTLLTAAHCLPKYGSFLPTVKAYLGYNDVSYVLKGFGTAEGIEVNSQSVKIHPEYDEDTFVNDIAIIKLAKQVQFNEKIQPACLPSSRTYPDKINLPVYAVGWGTTDPNVSKNIAILRNVKLTLYGKESCRTYTDFNIDIQICAGELAGGKDTCQGDSGGPLFFKDNYNNEEKNVLLGITSYGQGCALKNTPGVYTRVGNYLTWIRQNI